MIRLIGLLLLLVATPALADDPAADAARDHSRVDGSAATGMRGLAAVNLAAGSANAQANVRSLASGDLSVSLSRVAQRVDAAGVDATRDAQAVIGAGAFSDFSGVLGLNQAAGGANAQANVLAIAVGPGVIGIDIAQQVDNAALAATAADAGIATATDAPAPVREARIDAGALAAPTGVVQINQTAGVGNASANAIVLHLPGGTP